MALITVQAPPGVNSQVTQVKAGGRWFDSNLIRYRQGDVEKYPGWQRLMPDPFFHFIRRLHAWLDLKNHRNLMVGTDQGLQLVHDETEHTLAIDAEAILSDPRQMTWYLSNLGEDGLALRTGGLLRVYHPDEGATPSIAPVPEAPITSNGMTTAMPQAQVILWGTEDPIGSDFVDPLLLRFSDVGTYNVWIGAVINQAGVYRLSRGSRIVSIHQAPQTTLIFTDTDVWSMSYIGPPLIYGFTIMGTGCGLVAPHAVVTLGRTTYWQGAKGLWQFGDSGVQPVISTVHDYMFEDLDASNIGKCHAGANTIGNEVTFYFPCRSKPFRSGVDDTGPVLLSNEPTRYIKFNTVEAAWDKGKLGRTAWINNNVFGMPLGADLNWRVQQHERGFDDDDQPMRGVFVKSGFAAIAEGASMVSVHQCQPDFKWFGNNGAVNLTLESQGYAGSKISSFGPYSMTATTQFFNPRARGRYMAVRFDWVERKGFSARIGAIKMLTKPTGRRP